MKIISLFSKAPFPLLCLLLILFSLTGCTKKSKKPLHLSRADSYFKKGQNEKARIEYLNVLRLDPTNAIAIRQIGEIYYNQGEIRPAFTYLNKSKELLPQDLEVRRLLSRIYLSAGQKAEARAEANAILEKSPDNDDAILMLADTISKREEIEKTRSQIQQ